MKKYLVLWTILSVFSLSVKAQTFSFVFESSSRNYLLHLPNGYNASRNYPLVLNFHGLNSNASEQQFYTNTDALADQGGFIVVYPNGINNTWNAGIGNQRYQGSTNDVGFVNALLDTLIKKYSIDQRRIYSMGMSMGGFFSHRLACDLSNRIAAIGSVTGLMSDSTVMYCNQYRKVPVVQIQGTNDPVVNYNGFNQSFGAEETINKLISRNKCVKPGDNSFLPNKNTSDQSTVELIKYSTCEEQSQIWFYKVNNGGHTWPGASFNVPFSGQTNQDINASREIWNFFKKFALAESPLSIENLKSDGFIKIYPNPSSQYLIIDSQKDILLIAINDISGNEVFRSSEALKKLDVSQLNNGTYILKLYVSDKKFISKIFVKN